MSASGDQRGWADYWKTDCAASCEPENPATALEIARLWQGWLSGLPDGTRILDVATGNGIVLVHAAGAARARGRRFALTGVDLADIDPPRYVRNLDPALRSAVFRGGVAAEALPFADASFDVVVSQYGLEYADLERALAETARVLVPGGALVWLAHAGGSGGDAGGAAATLELDLAPTVELCGRHPPAAIAREVLEGFRSLRVRGPGNTLLATALPEAERRLHAHRERIRNLLDAVLTAERLARVRATLGAAPWTGLETGEVRVGSSGSFIGIRIAARIAGVV